MPLTRPAACFVVAGKGVTSKPSPISFDSLEGSAGMDMLFVVIERALMRERLPGHFNCKSSALRKR